MKELVTSFAILGFSVSPFFQTSSLGEGGAGTERKEVIAQESLDLTSRDQDSWVSEIMADNIRLTLYYLKGDVDGEIDWDEVREPFSVSFTLKPGEVFAFHDDVLPEFKEKVVKTTGASFQADEGFKTDGYLFGDGVCHLASLMNRVASEAGLRVTAVNHDFRLIPGVPKEFGTAIYYLEGDSFTSQLQNLYIENIFDFSVDFTIQINQQQVKSVAAK